MTFLPPHDIIRLPTKRLGQRLLSFSSLDSTNSLALALALDPSNDGLVLLAREQTSGRGQYGRVWTAPPGSSVLLSLLLYPPLLLRRPALLTTWAALAVCETIQDLTGLQAHIKWPNDVLLQGKKVCGILIEQRTIGLADQPLATAVGIGLNVKQSADFFAQANLPLGGSLESLSGNILETLPVAKRLIERLDFSYDRLLHGDTNALEINWQDRLGLLGKSVLVEVGSKTIQGKLLEVTLEGVVLEEEGQIVILQPENIRHIVEAP